VPSEQTFTETALVAPKELVGFVPISNRLLRDTDDPGADDLIRRDLVEVLSLRADLAFIRGTGVGQEPRGIRNVSGVNVVELGTGNGAQATFDDLLELVGAARTANAPMGKPGWILHPNILSSLERYKSSDGHYLARGTDLLRTDPAGTGGFLLGFPFRTSTQIPANITMGTSSDTSEVYFSSDWDEAIIGEEDALRIDVSSEANYSPDGGTTWISAFQNRQSIFRATWCHDVGLRRPGLFWVVTGIRP
jgi:HK97 family phage major capsid protein